MKRHRCSAFLGLLVSGYVSCREAATRAISGLSPEVTGLKPPTRTVTPLMQAMCKHHPWRRGMKTRVMAFSFLQFVWTLYRGRALYIFEFGGFPEFPSLVHPLMDVHCCILCQRLQHHIALNRSKEKSLVEADEVKQQQLQENCYLSRRFSYTAQSKYNTLNNRFMFVFKFNPYGLLSSFDLRFLFYWHI